jgi:hypothetical protein
MRQNNEFSPFLFFIEFTNLDIIIKYATTTTKEKEKPDKKIVNNNNNICSVC